MYWHKRDLWKAGSAIAGIALFSTLVIVIGALFGFWRWRVDRRDAQDKELEDRRDEPAKRYTFVAEEKAGVNGQGRNEVKCT